MPVKRNRPERNLSGKRTLVANQNDVVSDEDKDLDKLKDNKHGIEKSNVDIVEDGHHGSDSIESGDDNLAIVEEDGKKKMFISSQSEADSESSDDGSSSSDNESDSSDDELPTEEYTSDAYENSDDDMPSSVELKYAKKGRTSKKGKSSPKRTLTNKSKKKIPLRL